MTAGCGAVDLTALCSVIMEDESCGEKRETHPLLRMKINLITVLPRSELYRPKV